MYKVLFLGQGPIADPCFEHLLTISSENLKISGCVSNKESSQNWFGSNQIYNRSKELNILFIDNCERNEDEILNTIIDCDINIIISVQHKWILSNEILKSVKYFGFNLHNARLPDYQGYYPYNHAILNSESEFVSTIHWMIDEVDCGNIALINTIPIDKSDTAYSLYLNAKESAIKLFCEFTNLLITNQNVPSIPLKGLSRFYSKNSLDNLRNIRDLDEIDIKCRAFYFPPFEPAYLLLNGKKFYVLPDNHEYD